MRNLNALTAFLLATCALLGCTSQAEVATKSEANVKLVKADTPPVTDPDIADADYLAFIQDNNAFGLELQQHLQSTQELIEQNLVFSPTSAQLALAMAYGAAKGDTALAMKTTLHDNLGSDRYHLACNRLTRELASRNFERTASNGKKRRIELAPANSLWIDNTVEVKEPYLDLLAQQYDSGLRQVDFIGQPDDSRLAINQWVMDNTHDRIKDLLLPPDITSATRFALVNALYFYGNWSMPFERTSTAPGTFNALSGGDVDASMMHAQGYLQYKAVSGSAGDTAVVQLPYEQDGLWMTLVLPADGQFEATRAQVSGEWLSTMTEGMTSNHIELTLPKFKIETEQLQLGAGLQAMGMAPAFEETADFSGMTDLKPLYIAHVLQKAFIAVDEDGTEAAAATAVTFDTAGIAPTTTVTVTFDRPFLFYLQDKSGLVLFSGQVVDPTQ